MINSIYQLYRQVVWSYKQFPRGDLSSCQQDFLLVGVSCQGLSFGVYISNFMRQGAHDVWIFHLWCHPFLLCIFFLSFSPFLILFFIFHFQPIPKSYPYPAIFHSSFCQMNICLNQFFFLTKEIQTFFIEKFVKRLR